MSLKIPSYRLHKGSGQAFVQIKGERHYLGKYGSPQSEERYQRFIAELVATPQAAALPRAAPGSNYLVLQLCAAYWEYAKTYYLKDGAPSRFLSTIKLALRHLRQLYGNTPARDFGPLAFRAVQKQFLDGDHARDYVNKLCAVVKRVFKWGASHELVPVSVHQALATVPGLRKGRSKAREPRPVKPVPDTIVDATLPHLPPVVADMVRFQRLTGARPGEVCSIRPCDVDRSGDVWVYRPEHHKTEHFGRERIIFIGPKAQDVLRPYLLRDAEAFCFSPVDSESHRKADMRDRRKTRVQPSQMNRRKARPKRKPKNHYTKDSYNRAVARACEAAFGIPAELRRIPSKGPDGQALPDEEKHRLRAEAAAWRAEHCWSPNQLRHAAATEIRRQFGLEAAQVTLGHAKADITQVYAERDLNLAAEVMRKIG